MRVAPKLLIYGLGMAVAAAAMGAAAQTPDTRPVTLVIPFVVS